MQQKFYRMLAKSRLIRRYKYLQEVNKILEAYITDRILNSTNEATIKKGRDDLLAKQSEIKEAENFISFLKRQ